MFEGDKNCDLCRKNLGSQRGNFIVTLKGYTHVFCDGCFKNKKDQIKVLVNEKN